MATYRYRAATAGGQLKTGVLEGTSRADAIERLRGCGEESEVRGRLVDWALRSLRQGLQRGDEADLGAAVDAERKAARDAADETARAGLDIGVRLPVLVCRVVPDRAPAVRRARVLTGQVQGLTGHIGVGLDPIVRIHAATAVDRGRRRVRAVCRQNRSHGAGGDRGEGDERHGESGDGRSGTAQPPYAYQVG